MIFSCDSKELRKALNFVKAAIPKKSCVKCKTVNGTEVDEEGSLAVSGTDLRLYLRTHIPATIDEPGEWCINVKSLLAVLPKKGMVLISCADNGVTVVDAEHTTVIAGESAEAYPSVPEASTTLTINCLPAMRKCLPFASTEYTGHFMNGINLSSEHGWHIAATDGRTLKIAKLETKSRQTIDIIIPRAAVATLIKKFPDSNMRVGVDGDHVRFVSGNLELVTNLVDGPYPDVQRLTEERPAGHTIEVDRRALRDALEHVARIYPTHKGLAKKPVNILARGNTLVLTATMDDEQLVARVDAQVPGDREFAVNPTYLLRCLDSIDAERVAIHMWGEMQPIHLYGDDGEWTVMMPMIHTD